MARKPNKIKEFSQKPGLIMIVGNYGSGKTEVAVNLAIQFRQKGYPVQLADLDIVNPYFRCREARTMMEQHGIHVVVPPGHQAWADLPIIVPEIQGMLSPKAEGFRMFDVGGDDVGAKLLSSFHQRLGDSPYALWQVINARRPFTDTVQGCVKMMRSIEESSRLEVNGLIANTHLITETDLDVILQGLDPARKVSAETGREIKFVTAMDSLADEPELLESGVPVVRLERHMLPPWIDKDQSDSNMPAARPIPIGRPSGVD